MPVPAERHGDVLIAIDKVDKIGKEGVAKELAEKGYSRRRRLRAFSRLDRRRSIRRNGSIRSTSTFPAGGDTGLENLRQIVRLTAHVDSGRQASDRSRRSREGSGYYTGAIMEINVKDLPAASAAAAATTI